MKGRRACWSINGGNRLAALLCKHYSVSTVSDTRINDCGSFNATLSVAKAPKKDGVGFEFAKSISIPSGMKWLKRISACKPFTDLNF